MLLDVNCLLAIAWPNHQHHQLTCEWFLECGQLDWKTCAVTELGFVRLSSNPAFTPEHVRPLEAINLLSDLKNTGNHSYLESPSPSGFENMKQHSIQGYKQTTDCYLLSLAESIDCQFVTLDKRITHLPAASKFLIVLE